MQLAVDQNLVSELRSKTTTWLFWGGVWERIYWGVGFAGITFSALSAAKDIVGNYNSYFAVAATIAYGFIGFANPQRRYSRYLRAYRLLDQALIRYQYAELTEDSLLKAHSMTEDLLNDDQTPPAERTPSIPINQKQAPVQTAATQSVVNAAH